MDAIEIEITKAIETAKVGTHFHGDAETLKAIATGIAPKGLALHYINATFAVVKTG